MKRPKLSLPINIRLSFNPVTGLYEITENGIFYELTYVQMNDLKIFYFGSNGSMIPNIQSWYNQISSYSRKSVKRTGPTVVNDNGFYPDE